MQENPALPPPQSSSPAGASPVPVDPPVQGREPENLSGLIASIRFRSYRDVLADIDYYLGTKYNLPYEDPENLKNILHFACERSPIRKLEDGTRIGGNKEAAKIVKRLLDIARNFNDISKQEFYKFINHQDTYGRCPIHPSIDYSNRELVKLLLYNGADVNLPEGGGENEVIRKIYKSMPEVLLDAFESHLKIEEDETDSAEQMTWVSWNFSPVTRVLPHYRESSTQERFKNIESQTHNLAVALRENKVKLSKVLLHPLVQLFLHYKYRKFSKLIGLSIVYHFIWSFASIYFFVDHSQFPTVEEESTNTVNSSPQPVPSADQWSFFKKTPWGGFGIFCFLSFYIVTLLKEINEYLTCPSARYYFLQLENFGQFYLLISIPIVGLYPKDYVRTLSGSVGLYIACLLLLGQLNKTEQCGIFMEILVKVTKKILKFLLFFSPLILAYGMIFRLLIPSREQFWFFDVIPKVVTMMTGEVGYDEVFHGADNEKSVPLPGLTKFAFLCFDLTVIVVLQNLLIGLTLSDIQELKAKATESHIAKQIEQIYLLEQFLLSPLVKMVIEGKGCQQCLLDLMVEPRGMDRLHLLPKELQEVIRGKMEIDRISFEKEQEQRKMERENSSSRQMEILRLLRNLQNTQD